MNIVKEGNEYLYEFKEGSFGHLAIEEVTVLGKSYYFDVLKKTYKNQEEEITLEQYKEKLKEESLQAPCKEDKLKTIENQMIDMQEKLQIIAQAVSTNSETPLTIKEKLTNFINKIIGG